MDENTGPDVTIFAVVEDGQRYPTEWGWDCEGCHATGMFPTREEAEASAEDHRSLLCEDH